MPPRNLQLRLSLARLSARVLPSEDRPSPKQAASQLDPFALDIPDQIGIAEIIRLVDFLFPKRQGLDENSCFEQNVECRAGHVDSDIGSSLGKVERWRLVADYTGDLIDEEQARWALAQAETFVAAVKAKLALISPPAPV